MNTIEYGQGAVNNTIGWGQGAKVGGSSFSNLKSIELGGIDDFVTLASRTQNFTDFTLSFWINPSTSAGASFDGIVGQESTVSQGGILRYVAYDGSATDGDVLVFLGGWSNLSGTVINGVWTHIVLTYDSVSNELKGYNNGSLYTTISNPNFSSASTNAHSFSRIGIRNQSLATCLPGNLDEMSVFSTALDATQINSIYNSGVPNDLSSLSPVHWWRMGDNDTAPTLTDNGSGGNNGTMTNFSTFSTDVPT